MWAKVKLFLVALFGFVNTHTCKYLVVICIDFRFFWRYLFFRLWHGIILADEQKEPGGIKKIVDRVQDTLDDIKFAVEAHKVKVIYLFAHSNCGRYAHAGITFLDDEEEQVYYEEQLRLAREIILEMLPNVEVRLYYARLSPGRRWVGFKKVAFECCQKESSQPLASAA